MGCKYPSDTLSSYQNELITELNSNRKFLLSKNHNYLNKTTSILKRKDVNLYSTQNGRNFITQSTNENLSELNASKNLELNKSNIFIQRLSLQKLNELFDDSDIESYNKPINLKKFTFMDQRLSISNKNNNTKQSLNSTLENTMEIKNKRKKNKKINKRKIKDSFLQRKNYNL